MRLSKSRMLKIMTELCKKHFLFRNRFGQLECRNCNYIFMKKDSKEPKQETNLIVTV